jgi:antitoxin component HigA of HigAB toxin-antitoxin module
MSTITIDIPEVADDVSPKPSGELFGYVIRFPLRPLRDDEDYDQAAEILEEIDHRVIAGRNVPPDVRDYHDVLAMLIRQFDARSDHMARRGTLPERMRLLLEAGVDVTVNRLADVAGVEPARANDVMEGRRGWDDSSVQRLVDHFKMDPQYFRP